MFDLTQANEKCKLEATAQSISNNINFNKERKSKAGKAAAVAQVLPSNHLGLGIFHLQPMMALYKVAFLFVASYFSASSCFALTLGFTLNICFVQTLHLLTKSITLQST